MAENEVVLSPLDLSLQEAQELIPEHILPLLGSFSTATVIGPGTGNPDSPPNLTVESVTFDKETS